MSRCEVVAEVAQAHDGSLGTAHAFIKAAAEAGADAIKFQTHIAEAESTPSEPWRVKFSVQDESRYDYWRRMEFTPEQWRGLAEACQDQGIEFLSSPFSVRALDMLLDLGMKRIKLASGELANEPLLQAAIDSGLPLLISTGMSAWSELDQLVGRIRRLDTPFTLMQCTTRYPTPLEEVGLGVMREFRERYGCAVGLSDHSGQILPSVVAAALGASVVEVHVTMSRRAFGPDVAASVTLDELAELVRMVRGVETLLHHQVDKDEMASELAPVRTMFARSLVAARDLPPGRVLEESDLMVKKPGGGLAPHLLPSVVGRTLARGLAKDEQLREDDLA